MCDRTGSGSCGASMAGFRSADVLQRSVYKDLVMLLQDDKLLSEAQLKRKGEITFEKDSLVEGGILNGMQNGTAYREVRQYRSGHHLVRYYFLSRVYSAYLESILSDFQSGPQPDVLIANSCIWDLTRFDNKHLEAYKTNLDYLFLRLKEVLRPECLIIWNMTMPVGYRDNYFPDVTASMSESWKNPARNLRISVVEGNFFSGTLADFHKLDVLDMHYHFRGDLRLRCHDSTHWNQLAHRKYSQILLSHIAMAWGVQPPKSKMLECSTLHAAPAHLATLRKNPKMHPRTNKRTPYSQEYITFNRINTDSTSGDGLAFANLRCSEKSFLFPTEAPPMNFGNFPSHAPYPQEDWNMKVTTRRRPNSRDMWTHPYVHPPKYWPRIY
ncbi:PC-esterase domain-containing protein 1A-like isoform X2 [Dendrobates tinctorius]|uniref:PC-esterase domain-containing protein 1A-like isoform X2 n=1 Tax=Dendrobates tinctorius TaxID=92724 RepID=UPI003CC92352